MDFCLAIVDCVIFFTSNANWMYVVYVNCFTIFSDSVFFLAISLYRKLWNFAAVYFSLLLSCAFLCDFYCLVVLVSGWFPNDSNSVLVAALKHSPSKRKSLSKPLRHEELIEHSKYTFCINYSLIRNFLFGNFVVILCLVYPA